nr:HlyD family efflux transporter periplasmic adaptor subunit [Tissierella sp.]
MSYEQRKTNREKREKRYKIIMLGFILIVILVFSFSLINKKSEIVMAEKDVFLKEIELQAVAIKDESVFKLTDTKDIDPSVLEGQKIPVGTKIGNATLLNDIKLLKKELKDIEDAILTLKNTDKGEVYKNDKNKLTTDYTNLVENLQKKIDLKDYKNIDGVKKEIVSINKKLNDLMPQNNLLGESIETLNEKKETIKTEINQKDSSYTSKSSGIVSYKVDGYENKFKTKEFSNYTYDFLSLPDSNINPRGEIETLKEFDSFKIIDNFQWYLALKISDRKDINSYEIGDQLAVKYPSKDGNLEIKGTIIAINNSSNKSVIILRLNKYLHELYNARFPKVKLIQEKIEGLKLPKDVIIDRKGEKGVYIKDFSGIVKYRPVKVLSTKDEITYIDKGDENLLINIDTRKKEVRTVSIYDEILLQPNKFKENQILD